jgi:hypothetical protein
LGQIEFSMSLSLPGEEETFPASLLPEMRSMWAMAEEIWDRYQDEHHFFGFVAADYAAVFDALVELRGRAATFLEWGSGLGVVTIMASRLGFQAHGIECEAGLVDLSRLLAEKFGPEAVFAEGSFIPRQYHWTGHYGDELDRTDAAAAPAYDELGMELRDFDLVYAYPWPGEQPFYRDILRQFGAPHARFLCYDVREGISLHRIRRRRGR